uniref:Uncharacterized protein n=1 Tax=Anguilla anguilla TaxID=7936 RepID=A0A0E9T189_ANGAN
MLLSEATYSKCRSDHTTHSKASF